MAAVFCHDAMQTGGGIPIRMHEAAGVEKITIVLVQLHPGANLITFGDIELSQVQLQSKVSPKGDRAAKPEIALSLCRV